jgi:hypothetical protein
MIKTVFAPTNEKQGNGKFSTLKKRKRTKKAKKDSNEFKYLANNDLTMKFDNSKDPIYFAFDYLENRSLTQLMGDFVKESFFEISNFVSKMLK